MNCPKLILLSLLFNNCYFFKKFMYESQFLRTRLATIPLQNLSGELLILGGVCVSADDVDTEH